MHAADSFEIFDRIISAKTSFSKEPKLMSTNILQVQTSLKKTALTFGFSVYQYVTVRQGIREGGRNYAFFLLIAKY